MSRRTIRLAALRYASRPAYAPVAVGYIRLRAFSSSAAAAAHPDWLPGRPTTEGEKAGYARFRPIIDAFEAPIDLAVAYGSGVIAQANKSGPPPLTDFIIATPSAAAFHAANLRQFPGHYPLYARVLGPNVVAWMTDKFGAGMWYVTMVKFGDLEVKYGVISTPILKHDLEAWDTLYVSGRLHKPVLGLACNESLRGALGTNIRAALTLALLQLPPTFTELQLYEQIAGISYSGDPRMSVPGAENPEKVKNIVRGPGVLEGFRRLYGPYFAPTGVRWEGDKMRGIREWRGAGEAVLEQPTTATHNAKLIAALPLRLRRAVARRFRPTVAGSMVDPDVAAARRDDLERRKTALEAGTPMASYDEIAFWDRVVASDGWRESISNEVRNIIRGPALSQSVKGLVTAGFSKSVIYSLAKVRKWWAGRQEKAAKAAKAAGGK